MSPILLQPLSVESCQATSLRGRRRSSIRSLNFVPRIFPGTPSGLGESAVLDEPSDFNAPDPTCIQSTYVVPLMPLSDAHVSDYSTNINTPRHHDSISIKTCIAETPSSTSPPDTPFPSSYSSHTRSITEPRGDSGLSIVPGARECTRRRILSALFVYFVCGWGDGVTGTVLPYFTEDFHLSYMTSSLLFAASTVGFTTGTLLVERLLRVLGRFHLASNRPHFIPANFRMSRLPQTTRQGTGHSPSQARYVSLVVASMLHACFFILMGTKTGYPTLLIAYAVAAFARSFLTASLNVYLTSAPQSGLLGYAYASWGIGAVVSPLVCQSILATGVPWPHFYFGSLVVSAINTSLLVYAFKPTLKEFLTERKAALDSVSPALARASERNGGASVCDIPSDEKEQTPSTSLVHVDAPAPVSTLRLTLSKPYLWALCLFLWLYGGSETTTVGFMVTYLLGTRHADPKTVGYVTSGFWAGLTVGRIFWGFYSPSLTFTQRKHLIHACIVSALSMHLLIWFVNSNIENAFSTGIIGTVYGPIFPACLGMATDLLPPDVQMLSMAIVSSFSSFGSAFFPFITGLISNVHGVKSLTYVTVALTVGLFTLWFLFPSKRPSRDEHSQ